jgi:pimeloyl-ACP methyl ester carboxylesterase
MRRRTAFALLTLLGMWGGVANAQDTATLDIRGKPQSLRLYGSPGHQPVIVASGDGGWFHLGPHAAATIAGRGYCVVGLDVRAYLESFTSSMPFLEPADVPGDVRILAEFVERRCGRPRPVVIGISEGAGLAILAASESESAIAGVIGIGLGDLNELAWRWRDAVIYLTHRVPNEPTFTVSKIIGQVAPLPLALIHSTHDEFAPLGKAQQLFAEARPPKRLWVVDASNHRFSGKLVDFNADLIEALEWIRSENGGVASK